MKKADTLHKFCEAIFFSVIVLFFSSLSGTFNAFGGRYQLVSIILIKRQELSYRDNVYLAETPTYTTFITRCTAILSHILSAHKSQFVFFFSTIILLLSGLIERKKNLFFLFGLTPFPSFSFVPSINWRVYCTQHIVIE